MLANFTSGTSLKSKQFKTIFLIMAKPPNCFEILLQWILQTLQKVSFDMTREGNSIEKKSVTSKERPLFYSGNN